MFQGACHSSIRTVTRDDIIDAFSDILWERLPDDKKYYVCAASDDAPPGIEKIRAFRDEEFHLRLEYEGKDEGPSWAPDGKLFDLTCGSHPEFPSFKVHDCLAYTSTIHVEHNLAAFATRSGEIRPWKLTIGSDDDDHEEVVDWFINGPGGWFIFPHGSETDFKVEMKLSLSRDKKGEGPLVDTTIERKLGGGSSLDSLFVSTEEHGVLVRKVPDELNPMPGTSIGIHYHKDWGRLPSQDERIAIAEAMGFVFDADLYHVGRTHINQGRAVYSACYDVRSGPTTFKCRMPRRSPLLWSPGIGSYNSADAATFILIRYLKLREEVGLSEALAYYHLANQTPTGYNFPLFYAAIQGLLVRWAKASGNPLLQYEMDPDEFLEAAGETIANLCQDLPEDVRDSISKNFLNANRLTQNQASAKVWDELTPISKEEKKAFDARHAFAHGNAVRKLLKSGKAIEYEDAYRRVFQRLVLTILRFNGPIQVHGPGRPTIWHLDARKLPATMKLLHDGSDDNTVQDADSEE